ncbi:flavodoxin domain-containing protein [Actinoplanes palleronii]|uniref:Flavodoxin n=1 Tax=Actinoplanes palleronii TaxID=113570 RepID=A0ABQ4BC63_9ACTN|nr:flavodoxin domain-containing protein [Actinoplanes palleronii]GIE68234.1 flavodoxin [Actinoplanes palleronii]
MTNILVAYATKNGTTREVAEAVATAATAEGAQVRVEPARTVSGPLTGWDLIVVGAPLYSGRWHRDAHRFLARHRDDLDAVPVAVFGMGPRRDEQEAWLRSSEQLDRALDRQPWLTPVAVGLFGGADRPRRRGIRADLRDWAAIGEWTRKVLAISGTV